MLEFIVARERSMPNIYASAQQSTGLNKYEYKIIMVIRRVLKKPTVRHIARHILSKMTIFNRWQ